MSDLRTMTTNLAPSTWSGMKPFCPKCDSQRLDLACDAITGVLTGVACHDCGTHYPITNTPQEEK